MISFKLDFKSNGNKISDKTVLRISLLAEHASAGHGIVYCVIFLCIYIAIEAWKGFFTKSIVCLCGLKRKVSGSSFVDIEWSFSDLTDHAEDQEEKKMSGVLSRLKNDESSFNFLAKFR